MKNIHILFSSAILLLVSNFLQVKVYANNFYALDEALPPANVINGTEPVFDFDGDGCLPSAGISRTGRMNSGLGLSGGLGTGCRSNYFLNTSNTLHRFACTETARGRFCGHFYALYFKKDQVFPFFGGGHRHDWEYAAVWTLDGNVTHGSYSAHGKLYTKPAHKLPFENGHLKIVYHKDGLLTHAFRFAKRHEIAENDYRYFVTPTIISWSQMVGDGMSNSQLRHLLNSYNYGSATLPIKDSRFLDNLNKYKPQSYPHFKQENVDRLY